MLYASVKVGYNAAHNLHVVLFPGTRDIPYFRTKVFVCLHMSIVDHFRKNILSAQGNLNIIYCTFYARYRQKGDLSEGIFCLCVEKVMHVLDPFFLHIKSWCRKTFHI